MDRAAPRPSCAPMRALILAALLLLAAPAIAGEARVIGVEVEPGASGWRFDVTVESDESGWDKYADGWEVLAPDGTRLGFRELFHPHVDEQPFTRSLSGVEIPPELDEVLVRAHDSVEGWGPPMRVTLPEHP
jgi:hypothetical protein